MSFGGSPSDIIIVVTFCKDLYRKCRNAGGEYEEISHEVRALHTVLRHLKYEVEAPESQLNRDRSIWGRQLAPIIGDCDFTLRQLDNLIAKYGRLAATNSGSPTSPRVLWDKVRFGSNEMDHLGTVRVKLISHKSNLTLFLDTIQLHQSGQMATTLDNHGGQLDLILDKVDGIAARMGQHNGSIMTNYDDDDKAVWKQFRRELVAEGFSSDVLQQHKDVLRAYIREIDQKGLLEEVAVDPHLPPTKIGGVNPERWLESVQSNHSDDIPPSFSSLNLGSSDSGSKELAMKEDNMKFPTTMKMSRPHPDSWGSQPQRQYLTTVDEQPRRSSEGSRQQTIPRLTSLNEQEVVIYHSDSSSDEDDDHPRRRTRAAINNSLVIRTSDLVAPSQALALRPLGSPVANYRSASFGEDGSSRSVVPAVEYGTSPNWRDQVPASGPQSMRSSLDGGRGDYKLAPDEHGNEITPDAKWTKVNRRLVSPEVLDQDGRRYEARPEFVAILGVLSRAEIEDLAARTAQHRYARHLRHHPPPTLTPQASDLPPQQPPRPVSSTIPVPIPIPVPISSSNFRHNSRNKREDTPSSTDHTTSSSETDTLGATYRPRNRPRIERKQHSYQGSDINVPMPGYPNPFGQPVPLAPPSPTLEHGRNYKSVNGSSAAWSGVPRSAPSGPTVKFSSSPSYYTHEPRMSEEKERERERSRDDGHRREHRKHQDRERDHDERRDRNRERERRKEGGRGVGTREGERNKEGDAKKSRWKENLTAAGIGGAAVSLFNVLSEAAEGI